MQISYIFDNELSIAFGFIIAVWASVFIDFWKRKNAQLAYEWDLADYEETEPDRPEYHPRHAYHKNAKTGKLEKVG